MELEAYGDIHASIRAAAFCAEPFSLRIGKSAKPLAWQNVARSPPFSCGLRTEVLLDD
jgi:hypothetical protein